jgi:hypothetical protein
MTSNWLRTMGLRGRINGIYESRAPKQPFLWTIISNNKSDIGNKDECIESVQPRLSSDCSDREESPDLHSHVSSKFPTPELTMTKIVYFLDSIVCMEEAPNNATFSEVRNNPVDECTNKLSAFVL